MLLTDSQRLTLRSLNRGWFNTTMLRRRNFDGQLLSMRKSGTHWLKYMLGLTISRLHDVPPPMHIQDDSVVGHPKDRTSYPAIPRIVTSHSEPHFLMHSAAFTKTLGFPKYLVLVRNPMSSLASDFEKHKDEYEVPFSTYLRSTPGTKRYYNNIWVQITFMNSWGAMVRKRPDQTMVVRYEELRADTVGTMSRVCDFFGLRGASEDLLREVATMASKSNMAARHNPEVTATVVRIGGNQARDLFSADDLAFAVDTYRRNLKYDFGYSFEL